MKMSFSSLAAAIAASVFSMIPAGALEDAPALSALAQMPVTEVTIFKDGNAFVLQQGMMPTDSAGNVLMDYLPVPVFGTFWPFVSHKDVKLGSATAGQRRVSVERTPLTIQELIEANPGASVVLTESPGSNVQQPLSYPATIIGLTERSSKELEATAPPNSGEKLPQKGNVVLLRTAEGTKAVPLEKIQDVTFKDPPKNAWGNVEFRNLLTLQLDWGGRKPEHAVEAGLMYLQRGLRWIPEYKVTIDGQGKAAVKLQATLVNELADMKDVTCHLVVGVPTFQFKDMLDPMALQQNLAQLSQYFQQPGSPGGQAFSNLSNAVMTQTAKMADAPQRADAAPEVGEANQVEDLHVFTVKHVTLKKGERMVVPVVEFTVPYRDIFVLDLPVAPPTEVWRRFNNQQQNELARLLGAPKAIHKIRINNTSEHPLTTAPALILSDRQVLAQGLMTYTPKGGSSDLAVTTAVDIQVKKTETETQRTPNATKWDGDYYMRVDLSGTVTLTNYRKQAVDLEVVRHVLGNITEVGQDGKVEMVNVLEDSNCGPAGGGAPPFWWNWWGWPNWWNHFNGIGRVTWKQKLEPDKSLELKYAWHYYWR